MRTIGLASLVALCLASSACFQMTTVVKVNGDGSGTIDHALVITKAALAQLRNFAALGGGGRGQPIDLTSEDQARAMASALGPGVTYVSSTPIDTPVGQGRRALYAFTDISQLRISDQPSTDGLPTRGRSSLNSRASDFTCTLTREPNGNAVLHISLPELNFSGALGDAAIGNPPAAQQLAMVRTLLAGARISIGVEPAGHLVRTNSPFVDGERVTLLDVNLDQVLGNEAVIAKLQAASTPDELKAALTDLPGLKIPLDREVTIEFTPAK
jgi:hypothetical protein